MDVDEGAADVIRTKDGGSDCIYVSLLFTVWTFSMNRRDSIFSKPIPHPSEFVKN